MVDGGIVGGPPRRARDAALPLRRLGQTRSLPSSRERRSSRSCSATKSARASALKMCYAAWTKGSAALLLTVAEAAERSVSPTSCAPESEQSIPVWPIGSSGPERSADAKGWRSDRRRCARSRRRSRRGRAGRLPRGRRGDIRAELTYASVYPLLTTRSLARPFTYRSRRASGRVRSSRSGSAAPAAAASWSLEDEPPPGVSVSAVERVVEELPPTWSSSRSGSRTTTARRPGARSASSRRARAKRRGERKAPAGARLAARRGGARELTPRSGRRSAGCGRRGGGAVPALRRDRERQDRGLPPGRRGARARPGRDRPRPGDRADAAGDRPLSSALRRRDRAAPLGPDRAPSGATSASGSRAARRASSSAPARRCSRRCATSA